MALGDFARYEATANFGFELKQPERVCHGCPTLAHTSRRLFLRQAVFVGQTPVGHRFFDGIEVGALNVLDERQFEQFGIGSITDDDGYRVEPGQSRRLQSSFAGASAFGPGLFWLIVDGYQAACGGFTLTYTIN